MSTRVSGYRVFYRSQLVPLASCDKIIVVLKVKLGDKPADFGFTMSGVTLDGTRDIGRVTAIVGLRLT